MKAKAGLIVSGSKTKALLAHLPGLAERLGPVFAPRARHASDLVRSLHAGRAVRKLSELDSCGTLIIAVPDSDLRRTVSELAAAELDWRDRMVVLFGSNRSSVELGVLAEEGALTGSLTTLNGFEDVSFVAEGHRLALREARRLVHEAPGFHEVPTSGKALYLAGICCGSTMLAPLVNASVQCLRAAGLNQTAAADLADAVFRRTLRSCFGAGKKAQAVRRAVCGAEPAERQSAALRQLQATLSRFLVQSAFDGTRTVASRSGVL